MRSTLRAFAMIVGAGLLLWRTGATWAVVLTFVTGGLLALALVMPRVYAPVSAGLDRIQNSTLRVVSWGLLSIVFVLIFIPGRLLFGRRHRGFDRSAVLTTYWKPAKPSGSESFGRQY